MRLHLRLLRLESGSPGRPPQGCILDGRSARLPALERGLHVLRQHAALHQRHIAIAGFSRFSERGEPPATSLPVQPLSLTVEWQIAMSGISAVRSFAPVSINGK